MTECLKCFTPNIWVVRSSLNSNELILCAPHCIITVWRYSSINILMHWGVKTVHEFCLGVLHKDDDQKLFDLTAREEEKAAAAVKTASCSEGILSSGTLWDQYYSFSRDKLPLRNNRVWCQKIENKRFSVSLLQNPQAQLQNLNIKRSELCFLLLYNLRSGLQTPVLHR